MYTLRILSRDSKQTTNISLGKRYTFVKGGEKEGFIGVVYVGDFDNAVSKMDLESYPIPDNMFSCIMTIYGSTFEVLNKNHAYATTEELIAE